MIEFAIVLAIKRMLDWKNSMSETNTKWQTIRQGNNNNFFEGKVALASDHDLGGKISQKLRRRISYQKQSGFLGSLSTTEKVDIAALFLFLLSYFVFNCVYWAGYKLN